MDLQCYTYNIWRLKSIQGLNLFISNANGFSSLGVDVIESTVQNEWNQLRALLNTYSRQQNYSSTWDNTCDFSLVWCPYFIISCLFKQHKDHDFTDLFQKTVLGLHFLKIIISSTRKILLPTVRECVGVCYSPQSSALLREQVLGISKQVNHPLLRGSKLWWHVSEPSSGIR